MSENINVSLDPQTWMWLQISVWVVIGLVLGLICVVTAWIIQEHWRTPLESKIIRKATRAKKPLLILERDDGTLTFQIGYKVGPEGILETLPKSKKDKRWYTGLVSRNIEKPQLSNLEGASDGEKKTAENTEKIVEVLANLATKKTYLEGARIPALVGYYGKSILTRIGHLVGVQILEKLVDLKPEGFVAVDLTTIKTLFGMPWDETQLAAQAQQKYQEGYWKGHKDSTGQAEAFKIIILMLIVMFGLLCAAVIIMKYF